MIPYDVDPELMDRIFGTSEYVEGKFKFFDDDIFREEDLRARNHTAYYYTDSGSASSDLLEYSELSDALKIDLLENYRFTDLRNKRPVGEIEYSFNSNSYGSMNITIYDTYSNTIEVLKKYDIYSDGKLDPEFIDYIEVSNMFPGIDIDNIDYEEYAEELEDVPTVTQVYNSKENIKMILDAFVSSGYYGVWYDSNNEESSKYSVNIVLKGQRQYDRSTYGTCMKGKVPDFVVRDTDN